MEGVFSLELRKEFISGSHARHPDLVQVGLSRTVAPKSVANTQNNNETSNGVDMWVCLLLELLLTSSPWGCVSCVMAHFSHCMGILHVKIIKIFSLLINIYAHHFILHGLIYNTWSLLWVSGSYTVAQFQISMQGEYRAGRCFRWAVVKRLNRIFSIYSIFWALSIHSDQSFKIMK